MCIALAVLSHLASYGVSETGCVEILSSKYFDTFGGAWGETEARLVDLHGHSFRAQARKWHGPAKCAAACRCC